MHYLVVVEAPTNINHLQHEVLMVQVDVHLHILGTDRFRRASGYKRSQLQGRQAWCHEGNFRLGWSSSKACLSTYLIIHQSFSLVFKEMSLQLRNRAKVTRFTFN